MPGMLAAKGTEHSQRELLAVGREASVGNYSLKPGSGVSPRDCGKQRLGGLCATVPQDL